MVTRSIQSVFANVLFMASLLKTLSRELGNAMRRFLNICANDEESLAPVRSGSFDVNVSALREQRFSGIKNWSAERGIQGSLSNAAYGWSSAAIRLSKGLSRAYLLAAHSLAQSSAKWFWSGSFFDVFRIMALSMPPLFTGATATFTIGFQRARFCSSQRSFSARVVDCTKQKSFRGLSVGTVNKNLSWTGTPFGTVDASVQPGRTAEPWYTVFAFFALKKYISKPLLAQAKTCFAETLLDNSRKIIGTESNALWYHPMCRDVSRSSNERETTYYDELLSLRPARTQTRTIA